MARSKCPPVPMNKSLYRRIQARAKRQFRWPSIYANAWVVREYKKSGGKYRAACGRGAQKRQGLRKWFDEKWVDLSRPLGPGRWASCGRPSAKSGRYPKCVPLARARRMTKAQIRSAIRRKRRVERHHRGGRAAMVPTLARRRKKRRNPSGATMSAILLSAAPALGSMLVSRAIVHKTTDRLRLGESLGSAARPLVAAGIFAVGVSAAGRVSALRRHQKQIALGLGIELLSESIFAFAPQSVRALLRG